LSRDPDTGLTQAAWFDSYGQPPYSGIENQILDHNDGPPRFDAWLARCGVTDERIKYNPVDLQSIHSDVCGQYAAYFCQNGLPKQNPRAWRFITRSVQDNDAWIRRLVQLDRARKSNDVEGRLRSKKRKT